jgi:hypothetical protein
MKYITHTICVVFCLWIVSCNNNTSLPANLNTKASLPDSFKFSPAGLKVITTFINREQGTMSTLYGNALALQQAIDSNKRLIAGELFTLVTWKQQPDQHWFGAKIPCDLLSVEILKTNHIGDTIATNYERYEGKTLVPDSDISRRSERIHFILDERPSVMP